MTVHIDLVDDQIVIPESEVNKDAAKEIPGAKHDKKRRVWSYPLSWATCVMARGVFGSELVVGDSLASWAKEEYRTRIQPALAAREARE